MSSDGGAFGVMAAGGVRVKVCKNKSGASGELQIEHDVMHLPGRFDNVQHCAIKRC